MSNSGDHGSWDHQPGDAQGQRPEQGQDQQGSQEGAPESGEQAQGQQTPDAWAQAPAEPQDPYGQPVGTFGGPQAQDRFSQPHTDPFGQQPDPFGQQPDPYGQQPDPYNQPSPYAQQPDPYAPSSGRAPSSGSSASDPDGQPGAAYGQASPGYGQQSPGYGPAGGAAQAPDGELGQSRLVVGLLGIFLGAFGVHRFLLGYTTIGIIQVCITVLSCGALSWVSGIWGLIEGILVLTRSEQFLRDAHGRPLTD